MGTTRSTPPTTPHRCGFISSSHHLAPSPPNFCKLSCHLVSARAVLDLLSSLTQADADNETTHLIQETVSDACDGLLRLMEFVQMSMIHDTEELARELGALTTDLLTLIVLSYFHKYTRVQEREV